jgi:hypothetical protein
LDRVTGNQSQATSDSESGRASRARRGTDGKPTKRIVGASDSPIRVETEEVSIISLGKKDKTKGKDPLKLWWDLERSPVDEKRKVRHVTGSLACSVAKERSKEYKLSGRPAVILTPSNDSSMKF